MFTKPLSTSSVRFSDTNSTSRNRPSQTTQTADIHYASIGTDPPPKAPERGTQTDRHLLWNPAAAKTLRIDADAVNRILRELDRANRETALFAAYEQKRRGGIAADQERISIRLLRSQELPKPTSASSPTSAVTAILCGPGSRTVLLVGEPQHDSGWCTDHQGHLQLVHRNQTHSIPLPACPSELLFGRYGELLIVGLHSGDILLLSGARANPGELLWSSGALSLHSRAVTQFQWLHGQQQQLLSVGLDGKVLRSRLEPPAQLVPQQNVTISLADLPRQLRKANTGPRPVGLVGMATTPGQGALFVATETGGLLELDQERLELKQSMALGEADGGPQCLEQIGTFGTGEDGMPRFVWRNADGRIWQQGTAQQQPVLLPLGESKQREFCLLSISADLPLLLVLSDGPRGRQLLGWDLAKSQLVLRDTQIGGQLEAIGVDQTIGDLLVGISGKGMTKLHFYEITIDF